MTDRTATDPVEAVLECAGAEREFHDGEPHGTALSEGIAEIRALLARVEELEKQLVFYEEAEAERTVQMATARAEADEANAMVESVHDAMLECMGVEVLSPRILREFDALKQWLTPDSASHPASGEEKNDGE